MPGERTLYRKIQVILDYAKERKHRSVDDLEDYIYERSPTNFVYYWRDEKDRIQHDFSKNSIRFAVQMCIDLGLIIAKEAPKEIGLTPTGVSAADPRRFPTIVGNRAAKLLASKGVDDGAIKNAISSIVRSSNPRPPTAEEIWSEIQDSVDTDLHTFKLLMTLLGQCHVLWMSQKRIYLPVPPG